MENSQKRKQTAIFESVAVLAGVILFLWLFSSDSRAWVQLLLASFVIFGLVWVAYNVIKPDSESTFKTFNEAKQSVAEHGTQTLKEPSYERKLCPKCERELILKTSRIDGTKFWGCSDSPYCMFVLDNEA
jgi:hypothetical protein